MVGTALKRTRIKPVSKKRAAQNREYDKIRIEVYERAKGRCEARAVWSCTGAVEQVHHKQGRTGDRMTDIDKMMGLCYPCHDFITKNPTIAYQNGWMLRRNSGD